MKNLLFFLLVSFGISAHAGSDNDLSINTKKTGFKAICTNTTGDTIYMGIGKTVSIWSTTSTKLLKKIDTDIQNIRCIQTSPADNKIIIAGSTRWGKGKLIFLNRQSLSIANTLDFEKKVIALSISEDGSKMAISVNQKVLIYDYNSKSLIKTFKNDFHSLALDLNEDGSLLTFGGSNKRVILYDLTNDKELGSVGHGDWVRKAEISFNENLLISAGDDENIYFTDISDKENFKTSILNGHEDRIYELKFSPDDKYIISGSSDENYIIWDVEKKEITEKHEIKRGGTISTIAFTAQCKQLLTSSSNSKSLEVLEISHLRIIPRNQLLRNKDDKDGPQIYVSSPEKVGRGIITTYKDPFPVTGTIVDESGLRKVVLNSEEIQVRENGNFAQFVPLAFGENPISIEATDINGNISLKKFTLVRKSTYGEILDSSESTNFLLVIGINKYEHWPALNNAVRDAESVERVLLKDYDFEEDDVTILLDLDATRNNIYKSLRQYIELVGPNDNLLIYYAGHGHFDKLLNEGYWIPSDAQLGQEAEYLPNTTILKIIGNINSKHTFLVADACFSGSLFAERQRGYNENVERYKSRWGLASGRLEEVSDGSGQHSPFASSFVRCLEESEKESIAASEVIQYVKEDVSGVSNQTPRGSPLKNVGDEGGEFVFKRKD